MTYLDVNVFTSIFLELKVLQFPQIFRVPRSEFTSHLDVSERQEVALNLVD